jgi:hypothetical protein
MQIVLRKMIHFELNNASNSELVKTSRGDGVLDLQIINSDLNTIFYINIL